jgi:transposase
MTSLPDNILHLPEYHVLGTKMEEHDLHYQVEAPEPLVSRLGNPFIYYQ